MEFHTFKVAVARQFERMKKHELFRAQVEKEVLWSTYLNSFPAGSNPIYKERTEHDCNACKQFIRGVGNVVAVIDGKVESIWDVDAGDPNYQAVTDALSTLVKAKPIENVFLHFEKVAGTDKNFQAMIDGVKTWEHFFINVPTAYVVSGKDIPSKLGETRSTYDVLARALAEISVSAVDTVLELIAQNTLYRGSEHKFVLDEFYKVKKQYDKLPEVERDAFVWTKSKTLVSSVARVRSTVIGTLLVDLSNDKELDDAVNAFEAKVAPTNYKRPTALVTKGMVEKAKKTIEELGLTSALTRRFATLADVTINNILFANRDARQNLSADVFDALAASVPAKGLKALDKVEEVTIDNFIANVLPRAESIRVMVENRHAGNFVSLIAPNDPTAELLFKWQNKFSWSYNGEVADSIKERVKLAGGNVTGDLCCRLAWFNHDDLDFHMYEPNGYKIYFGNRNHTSPNGGRLDVDMNAGYGQTREPVENIFYADRSKMKEGTYTLKVHNFCRRETSDVGFEVELDFLGEVYRFTYAVPVKDNELITVAEFSYSHKDGVVFKNSLPTSRLTREVWGIASENFHDVNLLMLSPNHWDGLGVGNKHYFFMLNGCVNDTKARGFFNEFLKQELDAHRKVIEMVGSKMQVAESSDQLSGLGFSSTKRNSVLCEVKGNFSRIVRVTF